MTGQDGRPCEHDSGARTWAALVGIEVVSGTAEDPDGSFRGFVTVRAHAQDGSHMAGQLDPVTLRQMALDFLEAAEAAEQDAIAFTMLVRELDLIPGEAAHFVSRMRDHRGQHIGPRPPEKS